MGRGATAFSALALTLILPNIFEDKVVGEIYFGLSVAALVSVFARWGLDNSANAKIAKSNVEDEASDKASIIVASLIGIVLSSILWFFLGQYILGLLSINLSGFGVAGISFLSAGMALSYILFQIYRIDGAVIWGALTRGFFINAFLITVSLSLFAYGDVEESDDALFFWGVAVFAFSLLNIWFYIRKNAIPLSASKKETVISLFSTRFFGYSLLLYFITDADYYFIQVYLDSQELAVYASMKRLAVMAAIYTDIAHLILPNIYKKYFKGGEELIALAVFRKLSALGFLGGVLVSVVAYFFLSDLALLFWRDSYLSGVPALTVMLLGFALTMSFGFSEMWLLLQGDKNALLISMVGALLVCLLANSALTPRYGIMGAALSFSLSNIVLRLGMSLYVLKKYRVSLMMWWR